MAVPSRVFVGVVVFGLIVSLSILGYVVVLVAYDPPPESPVVKLFPEEELDRGELLFLGIAGTFSLAFTVFAWRALLAGARRDMARLRIQEELKEKVQALKAQRDAGRVAPLQAEERPDRDEEPSRPPGYA